MSLEIFDRSIISFFNTDMKEAHRNIESIGALENICGDINNMVLKQDTMAAVSIGYIAESVRRAGEYAGDISETVINLLVENELDPTRQKQENKFSNALLFTIFVVPVFPARMQPVFFRSQLLNSIFCILAYIDSKVRDMI